MGKKSYPFLCLLVATLAIARPVQATLGEPADSIETDSRAISAVRNAAMARAGYTVRVIASDSVTVREYCSPSGIVFGIAWNGLIHPDLTTLLGSYSEEYQKALRQNPRKPGRRFSLVKTDRIVVEKWGHMRNLQGRAYVPALIPPGVTADEIK